MGLRLGEDASARWNVEIKVLDATTGEVLETRHVHNLITTLGFEEIARRIALIAPGGEDYFCVGTGTTTPEEADTELETETYDAPISSAEGGSGGTVFVFTLPSTQCNSTTLTECGIKTYDDILMSRAIITPGIAKTSGTAIAFAWTWTFGNLIVIALVTPPDAETTMAGIAPTVIVA